MNRNNKSFLEKKFGKNVIHANASTFGLEKSTSSSTNNKNVQINFQTCSVDDVEERECGSTFSNTKEYKKLKENPLYDLDYELPQTSIPKNQQFKPSQEYKKLMNLSSAEIIEKTSGLKTKFDVKSVYKNSSQTNALSEGSYGGKAKQLIKKLEEPLPEEFSNQVVPL